MKKLLAATALVALIGGFASLAHADATPSVPTPSMSGATLPTASATAASPGDKMEAGKKQATDNVKPGVATKKNDVKGTMTASKTDTKGKLDKGTDSGKDTDNKNADAKIDGGKTAVSDTSAKVAR